MNKQKQHGAQAHRAVTYKRLQLSTLVISVALAIGILPEAVHAQGNAAVQINIASQPLHQALLQLGQQTDIQIYYVPDTVAGVQAPLIAGNLTPQEALQKLLNGTDIEASWSGKAVSLTKSTSSDAKQLATVQVVGIGESARIEPPPVYAGGQLVSGARLGILGDVDVMDAPVSFVSFTQQTMENQQARSLADVLINDPSVRAVNAHGGFYDDFAIRGFNVRGSEIAMNGLFGLAASRRIATEILERAEVTKGPGALLTGMSPGGVVGGVINIVPKRAQDTPITRLTATYQSQSQLGLHADVGRRWGDDNQWGLRVNTAYRNGDTGVDQQHDAAGVTSMALDYSTNKVRATLDVIHQRENIDRPRTILEFGSDVTELPSPPDNKTNYIPAGYTVNRDTTVIGRVEYDILDDLTVFGALGTRRSYFDSLSGNPGNGDWLGVDKNGKFTITMFNFLTDTRTVSGEAGVRGRVQTGAVSHRWVLAYSGVNTKGDTGNQVSSGIVNSSIYQPVAPLEPPQYYDSLRRNSGSQLHSFAFVNTMSAWDDQLLLTLGLRHQSVKSQAYNYTTGAKTSSYDASANTPMLGLVIKPFKQWAVYANYMEALGSGGTAPNSAANRGEMFAPYKSKQMETGVKWDRGDLAATVAVFDIRRPNSMTDPVTKHYSFGGEQRNRGLELSLFGEVVRGLRLMGGAAWTYGKITRAAGGVNEGNTATGVPRQQYNANVEWDVPTVNGLTLTARATHTGAQFLDAKNSKSIPSWTRYDLGARYLTRIANKDVTMRLNVENVFNKDYWIGYGNGYVSLSMPTTVLLSATVAF